MDETIERALIGGGINFVAMLVVLGAKNYLSARPTRVGTALVLALIGAAMGAASASAGVRGLLASVGFPYGSLSAEIALVLTCLALAIGRARSGGEALGYQVDVLALWLPFVAAWLGVHGGYLAPFVRQAGVLYLACALVGGMLVLMLRRRGAT